MTTEREDEGELGLGGFPVIYDFFIENDQNQRLVDTMLFENPSVALLNEFTSNELFFNSPGAAAVNGGVDPRLLAPAEFDAGSSISHLDEFVFRSGESNSLMSPRIARGEAIHDPGAVTVAILEEIGWNSYFTSLARPEVVRLPLQTFPNPVRDRLQVRLPETEYTRESRLVVVDMAGRPWQQQLLENRFPGDLLEVDLHHLPAGVYSVLLLGRKQLFRARVVKW